mgnify:CR=1 FL=1
MLPGTRGGEPVRAGGGWGTAGSEVRSTTKVGDWAMEGLGSELVPVVPHMDTTCHTQSLRGAPHGINVYHDEACSSLHARH